MVDDVDELDIDRKTVAEQRADESHAEALSSQSQAGDDNEILCASRALA